MHWLVTKQQEWNPYSARSLIWTQVRDQQALPLYLLPPPCPFCNHNTQHSPFTVEDGVFEVAGKRSMYTRKRPPLHHTHTEVSFPASSPQPAFHTQKPRRWLGMKDGWTFYPVTHTQRNRGLSSTKPKTMSRSQIYSTTLARPLPFLNFAVGL